MNSAEIARIRLAGFANRQAGYWTEKKNSEVHESGLPDLLTGKPVMGQIKTKPKTAYRILDPEIRK